MTYTGRTRQKGYFLGVYERVGISLVEVYKRVRELSFRSVKRSKGANRIYGCKKCRENFLVLGFTHIVKIVHLPVRNIPKFKGRADWSRASDKLTVLV